MNSVPNIDFSPRQFEFIQRFQSENGFVPNGIISRAQIETLKQLAFPALRLWGFRKVGHPVMGAPIWIPIGLASQVTRTEAGVTYADPKGRLKVVHGAFRSDIRAAFADLLDKYAREGTTVHYRVMKDGWFVLSITTAKGVDGYLRYHQVGGMMLGFTLTWDNALGDVSGERAAILMSSSLVSALAGAPFVDPPDPSTLAPPSPPPSPPPVAAAPPPAPPLQEAAVTPVPPRERRFSSGTGFFVAEDGRLVTNHHVIRECGAIAVRLADGSTAQARLLAADATNDLALVKTDLRPRRVATLRIGARLGEGVAAFGYPHADILASTGNFTLGNVTALAGVGDDSRHYQISAPVQSGNSGGPLLDAGGNVVGVVVAKLDALKLVVANGDLPQNVNFAVKGALLATFLDTYQVPLRVGTLGETPLPPADLAEIAKSLSAFVVCEMR
ncbi:S1C family serine protease [Methylobacterium sp. JK268]